MLGEVEETIYVLDDDDEDGSDEMRTIKKQSQMLFVRGAFDMGASNEGGLC